MLHVSDKKCFAYDNQEEMIEHEDEMKLNGYFISEDKHEALAFYREYEMTVNKKFK